MEKRKRKFKIQSLKIFCFVIAVFTFYFLLFNFTFAAPEWWPLVPCGLKVQPQGKLASEWNYVRSCTRCDGFKLVKNIIDFALLGVVPPLGALLFIVAGFMILLGGARPDLIARGRTLFWNTFIGLVIIFSAWLITNTLIKSFGPDQIKDRWYKFTCREAVITSPSELPSPPVTGACALCRAYQGRNVTCGGQAPFCEAEYVKTNIPVNSSSRTCDFAASAMAQKLQQLRQINADWVISEGFPPTVNHADPKHCNGQAIDITVSNPNSLDAVCQAAKQVGLTVVNGYSQATPNCGQPRRYETTTGNHLHLEI